jgi:hypothetical protein
MTHRMRFHRWVSHDCVPDYLLVGWMALPTLEGTGHGQWAAHCIWLCDCRMVEPRTIHDELGR